MKLFGDQEWSPRIQHMGCWLHTSSTFINAADDDVNHKVTADETSSDYTNVNEHKDNGISPCQHRTPNLLNFFSKKYRPCPQAVQLVSLLALFEDARPSKQARQLDCPGNGCLVPGIHGRHEVWLFVGENHRLYHCNFHYSAFRQLQTCCYICYY